jgi:hypothetical protein
MPMTMAAQPNKTESMVRLFLRPGSVAVNKATFQGRSAGAACTSVRPPGVRAKDPLDQIKTT